MPKDDTRNGADLRHLSPELQREYRSLPPAKYLTERDRLMMAYCSGAYFAEQGVRRSCPFFGLSDPATEARRREYWFAGYDGLPFQEPAL